MTNECVTSDDKAAACVYAPIVPRITRDLAAIEVVIDPHGAGVPVLGSGKPEQGGGLLRGDLTLANRFTAGITDPDVPFGITMTVGAQDGWLAIEAISVSQRDGGPAVSGMSLRSVVPSLYLQRVREELQDYMGAGGLLRKETQAAEHIRSWDIPLTPEDAEGFGLAQMRRAVRASTITPAMAADAYRAALASPDPEQNRRPTAAAADLLGVSRGYISTLLTEARRMGIDGLGPQRPRRTAKED